MGAPAVEMQVCSILDHPCRILSALVASEMFAAELAFAEQAKDANFQTVDLFARVALASLG